MYGVGLRKREGRQKRGKVLMKAAKVEMCRI